MRFKRQISILYILLSISSTCCSQISDYIWKQEVPPGNGSFQENWTPGKFPMGIIPVVAFDGNLYMVGNEKTWISKNGVNWAAHQKTNWGERHGKNINRLLGQLEQQNKLLCIRAKFGFIVEKQAGMTAGKAISGR